MIPAHYNPTPMFGLRSAPEQWPNAALSRNGEVIAYITVDWSKYETFSLMPPPLQEDDIIVFANSSQAESMDS